MKKIIIIITIITTFFFFLSTVYALDISIDEIKVLDRSENMTISNVTSNNLTIMTSESFNIKSTYTNLNQISKGKYPTDLNLQSKIKKISLPE